jgi:hypothetical protein
VRAADQAVWRDDDTGFTRRSLSPPHAGLRGELVEAVLRPAAASASGCGTDRGSGASAPAAARYVLMFVLP